MLSKRIVGTLAVAVISMGAMGCQNKLAKERDELYVQNREQQAKIDAMNAERERQASAQVPAPVPTPPPVPMAPTPMPAPQVVTPAPVAPAPMGPPTIENAETTTDVATGNVTVNIQGDVLFDAGKADLRAPAKKTLDQVVSALNGQYKGKTLRIEGHTDADPIRVSKWKSNQELSEVRAKAVRDYLVSKGVEASRVTTTGFGADKPKGTVKSKNRRVEIVVITR